MHLNSGRLLTICIVSKEYKGAFNEGKTKIERENIEKSAFLIFQILRHALRVVLAYQIFMFLLICS